MVVAPRLSASYDLAGDGKTLLTGSYGRYYASIIQGFSDAFANVPQQENYDLFTWNGSQYVFTESVRVGGSDFQPNTDLEAVPHGRIHGRLPAAVRPQHGAPAPVSSAAPGTI